MIELSENTIVIPKWLYEKMNDRWRTLEAQWDTVQKSHDMTWQNALFEAGRLLAAITERLEASGENPGRIRVAIYPSPHDYRYFRGKDPWPWEFHTSVCRALRRLAARKKPKLKVDLFECDAAGCAAWCEERGLVSDTKNRDAYVAFKNEKNSNNWNRFYDFCDWSMSDVELAKIIGVSSQAVWNARKVRGIKSAKGNGGARPGAGRKKFKTEEFSPEKI